VSCRPATRQGSPQHPLSMSPDTTELERATTTREPQTRTRAARQSILNPIRGDDTMTPVFL
jgi:hypothetical protein